MKSIRYWFMGCAALVLAQQPLHAQTRPTKTIAITQIVEHPDLDNVRRGLMDALGESAFDATTARIVYESAQGDIATAVQIAKRFVDLSPDVIVAISTPSAQAAARATSRVPVVFGAVGDPVGAGLVGAQGRSGKNVTGTSSFTPVEPQLALIHKLLPQAKRIGILNNPAEANSRAAVVAMTKAGTERGFQVIDQNVVATSEIATATTDLVGKVDVIFTPTDNTVSSGADTVMRIAAAGKVPVFSAESVAARRGALAAVGLDWYQVGRSTGEMVVRVLNGEKPGEMDVWSVRNVSTRLNARTARTLGVTIPPDVAAQATEVIDR